MPLKKYLFFSLFLFFITSCQLAELHLDCPTGNCEKQNRTSTSATQPPFPGYYRLKTKFRGAGESLEDAQGLSTLHNGAVFMNKNQDIDSQLWEIEDAENGYFRLRNKISGDERSLEANNPASPYYGGATFMDKQQNVIGQYWKLIPVSDGYYQLKIKGTDNLCLEGNQAASNNLNGAAFMANCSNQTGQLWKLESVQ